MPTKSLLLDGPDLEELLARAMNEAGPGGRVASADRVRRGGIGGFFAREHFEVVIEIDDYEETGETSPAAASSAPKLVTSSTGRASSPPAGARNWTDLAEGTEDFLDISGTTSPSPEAEPASPAAPAALGSEARMPSTQKASFAAMLTAIARDTVADEDVPAAIDATGATVLGDDPTLVVPAVTGPAETAPPATTRRRQTFTGTTTTSRSGAWIEAIAEARPEPEPAPAAESASAHLPNPAGDGITADAQTPVLAAELFAHLDAAVTSTGIAATGGNRAPIASSVVQPALASLGLPADLLPEDSILSCLEKLSTTNDAQTYVEVALTSALQRLPAPPQPPDRPGSVMVIVGDLDRALECAATLADRAGIDLDTIVVASQARHRRGVMARHRLSTPEEAAELASRSRRMPHPVIVAMHAPVSAEPDRWAMRLLAALSPAAVWGVASATHKCEDLAAWGEGLGGLDALALEDLAATTSPADALASGIPVAILDGQHATPALWAALIAARLLIARVAASAAPGRAMTASANQAGLGSTVGRAGTV